MNNYSVYVNDSKKVCKYCGLPSVKLHVFVFSTGRKPFHGIRKSKCIYCTGSEKHPQFKARNLVYKFPHKIKILSECACENVVKIKHHPDYSKPFEVELLCNSCHRRRHFSKN